MSIKRKTDDLQSHFASMVSHELRTPLSSIKVGIDMVIAGIDGPINESQRVTLGVVKDNVDRLTRLIDGILDYTRMQSGKMKLRLQRKDLKGLIRSVYDLMAPTLQQAGIEFGIDLPSEPVEAVCDADKIKQVLINLTDNARKFTDAGGSIRINLTPPRDGEVAIEVKDTGIGISQQEQGIIFEMFRQAEYRGMWKTGGSGVGLAVCKLIMELHQGRIELKSAFGRGSDFTIIFPDNLAAPA